MYNADPNIADAIAKLHDKKIAATQWKTLELEKMNRKATRVYLSEIRRGTHHDIAINMARLAQIGGNSRVRTRKL